MKPKHRLDLWRAERAADRAGLRELRTSPARPWPESKHWDLRQRLAIAHTHIRALGLDTAPPRRILDLGTGCGYFPYLAQTYGHRAVGLDQAEWELGAPICSILGVERVEHDIRAFEPLPDLGRFDLITALLLWFNTREEPKPEQDETWGPEEWDFFLDDLAARLTDGGEVYLTLGNTTPDGFLRPAVVEHLRGRGATVDGDVIRVRADQLHASGALG